MNFLTWNAASAVGIEGRKVFSSSKKVETRSTLEQDEESMIVKRSQFSFHQSLTAANDTVNGVLLTIHSHLHHLCDK